MPDEVVLALDLYLAVQGIGLRADWDSLSDELRKLPVQRHFTADPIFRNWQAVRNKLYNLQWLDTNGAQGRENVGAPTQAVWDEYGTDAERVAVAAEEIRQAYRDSELLGDEELEDDFEADESAVVIAAHRRRERDPKLGRRKRQSVENKTGHLACEACGFDSEEAWGVKGIVECHHLKPVSELQPGEKTKLTDVRLLCPNCHRLVHSKRPWLGWDELVGVVGAAP
jgi:5-methylcytosine-specific restriction enzyme A